MILLIKTPFISCCRDSSFDSEPSYVSINKNELDRLGTILHSSKEQYRYATFGHSCCQCGQSLNSIWFSDIYDKCIVLYKNPSKQIMRVINKINKNSTRNTNITSLSIMKIMVNKLNNGRYRQLNIPDNAYDKQRNNHNPTKRPALYY